jgi:hypothetical protein
MKCLPFLLLLIIAPAGGVLVCPGGIDGSPFFCTGTNINPRL